MRVTKLLAVAAATAFAAATVGAASAFAAVEPEYVIEVLPLAANETISAEAVGAQVASGGGVEMECPTLSLENGELHPEKPGTDSETIIYAGCHEKGNAACEARTKGGVVAGQVQTKALRSKLFYRTKGGSEHKAAERGKTDTVFKPAAGKIIAEVEFKGVGCPLIAAPTLENEIAFENEEGERVEQTLKAPAAPIKVVWEEVGVEVKVKEFKAFGAAGTYVGQIKLKLAGANVGRTWGVKS